MKSSKISRMGSSTGVAIGLVALILVLIGLVVAVVFLDKGNRTLKTQQLLIPFASSTVQVDPDSKTSILNMKPAPNGRNQISCPVGKINVVGAFFDVYDGYGTCSPIPSPDFASHCENPDNKNDPICQNLNATQQNTVCVAGGTGNCKMRDVTQLVANVCNGQTDCDPSVIQKLLPSLPYPCTVLPTDPNYLKLPVSSSDSASGPTQGYYLHGIFSCVE